MYIIAITSEKRHILVAGNTKPTSNIPSARKASQLKLMPHSNYHSAVALSTKSQFWCHIYALWFVVKSTSNRTYSEETGPNLTKHSH